MGYVALQLGEILSLLTYRRDDFSFPYLFTNKWYVGALTFNIFMMTIFVYVPAVFNLLGLVPLPLFDFVLALCLGMLLPCINEMFKIYYRSVHRIDLQQSKELAHKTA